jgi:hypothetical protein
MMILIRKNDAHLHIGVAILSKLLGKKLVELGEEYTIATKAKLEPCYKL